MKKILFVCHGNICRSPMAEYVMKYLVEQAQLTDQYMIASAATSTEEIGNPVYPPARRKLAEHGISCNGHAARQMTRADYAYYDHIICMDQSNLRWLNYIIPSDSAHKVTLLKQWVNDQMVNDKMVNDKMVNDQMVNISDPWYTGDFEKAYNDILEGCQALLNQL